MNALVLLPMLFASFFDLGSHFANPEAWAESAVDFTVEHQDDGFRFASQKRDIVICQKADKCVWHGLKVYETRIYYAKGAEDGQERVERLELSLYNRGDDRSGEGMDAKGLESLLFAVAAAAADLGDKSKPKTEREELKQGGYRLSRSWMKAEPTIALVWGVDKLKVSEQTVDFVRVTLAPKAKERPKGATKVVAGNVASKKIKDNVSKNAEGDVWVRNVPMVDQGQKGYCAVAVCERILRYYGHDVDEHELAQMADSTAEGGTSGQAMKAVAQQVGVKKRLGFNLLVSMLKDVGDLEKQVKKYNEAAKGLKERQLDFNSFVHGNMICVSEIQAAMKPKVLKQMRTHDARYKQFRDGVRKQIDQGVPVAWSVQLGIYPEPEIPQVRGGHMRLIIGYNAKTKEILYSDTWGAGHELKRMPEDWAFTITMEAFYLRPL